MIRTPNRLRSGQTGAVGMIIIMWLAVVVLIGVAAIDAGSIAFTKFRLADVASSASTQAANAFRTDPNTVTACQTAETSIATGDRVGETGEEGLCRQHADGGGDGDGPQGSQDDHRNPSRLDQEVHQGERHRDQRADRPVALSRVTEAEPDEELVRRYLAGDERAFSILVERHQTRVFNIALRVLGDPDDARDAAQDAFLSMLRKLSQFRGDSAFTTWLHRVTVNSCYDILRKRRRQPMLRLVGDEDDPIPETGPPVADHADATVASIDVARALQLIPEEYRVTLVLADIQDIPYEEIARVLDVPMGTVKSRVHRGRIALARAMGMDEPGREPSAAPRPSERES